MTQNKIGSVDRLCAVMYSIGYFIEWLVELPDSLQYEFGNPYRDCINQYKKDIVLHNSGVVKT